MRFVQFKQDARVFNLKHLMGALPESPGVLAFDSALASP
jgi:hypothetical protein